ncbi:uncharacterized protein MKK02DRAFT_40363 [Dioszegia hungarica]|uniref:Uncharacterized protein n=1 Tax=Dioszegia hungarica TaxID=4972 RepID=A0AA38LRW5_9TREE|nr:uncharacterized protein MKK02DRAFT_40363 [Dioszegia hungarica]KAI9632983.1 hypothetical protein MKK02DRAFT_40363 [Dioszegia hungarica]
MSAAALEPAETAPLAIAPEESPERPCTPPLPSAPAQDCNLPKSGEVEPQGGSVILIDPTTNEIIGTLTPASPGEEGTRDQEVSESDTDTLRGHDITGSAVAVGEEGPKRRDPTYSYRLSISDLSLRTFAGAPSTITEQGGTSLPTAAEGGGGGTPAERIQRGMRSSWMTDDASFWTARGTLRFEGPVGEEGSGKDREVVVAYVKTDTPLNDLFPPYIPSPRIPRTPRTTVPHSTLRTHSSTLTTSTDSPFPSRILHLFPRLSTLPRGGSGGVAGSGLPSSVTQGISWPSAIDMDPASLAAAASSHAEAAFWRLVMPGISGVYGWTGVLGQAYEQLTAYLPLPSLQTSTQTSNAPLLIDSSVPGSAHTPGLYSDETIYTLRMPPPTGTEGDGPDLGPTIRPVWVKKRAALPVFEDKQEGWGRENRGIRI